MGTCTCRQPAPLDQSKLSDISVVLGNSNTEDVKDNHSTTSYPSQRELKTANSGGVVFIVNNPNQSGSEMMMGFGQQASEIVGSNALHNADILSLRSTMSLVSSAKDPDKSMFKQFISNVVHRELAHNRKNSLPVNQGGLKLERKTTFKTPLMEKNFPILELSEENTSTSMVVENTHLEGGVKENLRNYILKANWTHSVSMNNEKEKYKGNTNGQPNSVGTSSREETSKIRILPSFNDYYKQVEKRLFLWKFEIHFVLKLSQHFGLTMEEAEDWKNSYYSFLVLMGFMSQMIPQIIKTPPLEIPYAIVQTWRLHITFSWSYRSLCNLILGGETLLFNFQPAKYSLGKGSQADDYYLLKNVMYHLLFKAKVFEARFSMTYESFLNVWEDFEATKAKTRLNYCFVSTNQNKNKKFYKAITSDERDLLAKVKSSSETDHLRTVTRELLGLPELDWNRWYTRVTMPTMASRIVKSKLHKDKDKDEKLKKLVHQIDSLPYAGDFITLLLCEQGIGANEAASWMLEYSKFLFLGLANEDPKVVIYPSEIVAQVWYLHMQHVLAYDQWLAKERPFYSTIPTGNPEDTEKFTNHYKMTLKKYTEYFGNPPEHIWPLSIKRFNDQVVWKNLYYFHYVKLLIVREPTEGFNSLDAEKLYHFEAADLQDDNYNNNKSNNKKDNYDVSASDWNIKNIDMAKLGVKFIGANPNKKVRKAWEGNITYAYEDIVKDSVFKLFT
jgi:hypothetical protein